MDGVDKGRRIIALLAILALVVVVAILSFSDRTAKPMQLNGDMLGQDNTETSVEYLQRASESLADATDGEEAYSLVTFAQPLSPAEAGELLDGIGRVSAMVMLSAPAMDLPEPIAGETREDVFNRQIALVDAQLSGIGNVRAPGELNGVVVWDIPENVRPLAESPLVYSIETLPPDAAWGSFGVRPVDVE
ncbi:hypothetical protein P9K31_04835 [Corynebacterium glutamicum]|uniref:hypothetical protein n=1 Tax=Corynebacterium TaxID=1716 RepID=UPI00071FF0BB|nr:MULTISPECIES: hypothetical protein [Corynebacterium]ALP50578.1 hypothetical protein AC079_10350 [Corynebacterium glutamicum]ANR62989.1 hypothetical protein C628_10305 [[Brevibacterium] flavum ZL-1]ANR65994.1 hypothetical protein C627_10205 [Corynebacterium glutamicum ZL-6]ANU34099.1 hypothetical protein BBD29_10140 [Corynebacterium glutamicum]APT07843.1 hypothetical protein BSP99_10405 [Corynebacterium glutamicum]